MSKKEFSLLYEPWIKVLRQDNKTEEVSLLELFRRAPELRRLAGELPTQDIVVLRVLLAILHTVVSRYDFAGKEGVIDSPSGALERWAALWNNGAFPMESLQDYLCKYEERFYLFHPERPFCQVPDMEKGTDYSAAKLNGELMESANKVRLFPQRTGEGKTGLSYPEAARWLLHVNAFDDTSSKPKEKGLPSPGAGWLGKLGLVVAAGDNMFETLLLNLVLLPDGKDECWGNEKPIWEAETVKADERTKIVLPDNPSELLTLQSRRLLLKRDQKTVVGYLLLGGDFIERANALAEQMTAWRFGKTQDDPVEKFYPRRHDSSRQVWRDFPTLLMQAGSQNRHRPGVVSWLARLKSEELMPRKFVRFAAIGVQYGDKDFFVDDVYSDSISLNAALLTSLGEAWVSRIASELEVTEQLVTQLGYLSQNLAKATGDSDSKRLDGQKASAKEQAYSNLNEPFRVWLEGLDPDRDDLDEVCENWWEQAKRIVRTLGKEMVNQSGTQAFIGRKISEKDGKKGVVRSYNAPKSYNDFLWRTEKRQNLKGGKENA